MKFIDPLRSTAACRGEVVEHKSTYSATCVLTKKLCFDLIADSKKDYRYE